MDLRFAPLRMRTLDSLREELAVLPFFSDERPLGALAGLCDWRLCGRLSRLVLSRRLRSDFATLTMTPAGARLPFERLLFAGLGSSDSFSHDRFELICHRIAASVTSLRVRTIAVTLPGSSRGRPLSEEWGREFLSALHAVGDELDLVTIVDYPENIRRLSPSLEAEHRRLRTKAFSL
jgi:hypothetical protein